MLYNFLRFILLFVFHSIFRVKIIYKDQIPKNGGAILCSNHISYLDPILLAYATKHRKLTFMAKKELFKNKLFSWLITSLGAYPIDRNSARRAVESSAKILEAGKLVCMFPEGTRSKNSPPQDAKSGLH